MSPTPSPLNPSQTVERIREIIVGRHLERLEQRVVQLESSGLPPAAASTNREVEDRIYAQEARLEALKEKVQHYVEGSREEIERRLIQQREETHRLAAQIQQIAAMRASESVAPAIQQLEQKIATWLSGWQNSFQASLDERDQRLAGQLRSEVAALWESTESQLTRFESRTVDRASVEERFNRIALAARALAECASPSSGYATR
jgi:hypothetical protein